MNVPSNTAPKVLSKAGTFGSKASGSVGISVPLLDVDMFSVQENGAVDNRSQNGVGPKTCIHPSEHPFIPVGHTKKLWAYRDEA